MRLSNLRNNNLHAARIIELVARGHAENCQFVARQIAETQAEQKQIVVSKTLLLLGIVSVWILTERILGVRLIPIKEAI